MPFNAVLAFVSQILQDNFEFAQLLRVGASRSSHPDADPSCGPLEGNSGVVSQSS